MGNAEKVAEIESRLGQRGGRTFTHNDRAALRSWVQAKLGAKFTEIAGLSVPGLSTAYNDTTDKALLDIKAALVMSEKTETPAVAAAPVVEVERFPAPSVAAKQVGDVIASALAGFKPGLDSAAVEVIARRVAVEEASKVKAPERVIIESAGQDKMRKDMGVQHRAFPLLYKALEAGLHVALVGPAGTGKTTAAHIVADALGLPFECQSFCATTTKADLLGFTDAMGNYRDTPLRRAYVATPERPNGGVFCADEADAGNANSNVIMNAALANGMCAFPDGMKPRATGFRAVACMNTYGNGANRQYVGRNQLDAATLDRFAFIDWDTDEALEASMLGLAAPQQPVDIAEGGTMAPADWLAYVQSIRAAVNRLAVRHLVTPRASLFGAALFAAGVGRKHVEEMVLWKGLDSEQRKRVEKAA